jgi:hypothetical protein
MNYAGRYYYGWLIITLLYAQSNYADGDRSNVRGMGMARTYSAVADGFDAIGINPANLSYTDASVTFSFLPSLGLHAGSDFFDYDLYTTYFTGDGTGKGKYLTEADKRRIYDLFPNSNANTNFDLDVKVFSLTIHNDRLGSIGLSIAERAGFRLTIPGDYVKFLLEGNPLGSRYDFSATDFNAMWTREYSVSYGRKIPRLVFMKSMAAGFSIKFIQGFGYVDMQRNSTYFSTDYNGAMQGCVDFQTRAAGVDFLAGDSDGSFTLFPAPAGTGFGVDIGLSGFVDENFRVGVALVDIGKITWRSNTRETIGFAQLKLDDPFLGHQVDTLKDALKGESHLIGEFSTGLPTTLHMGLAYQLNKGSSSIEDSAPSQLLLLALDYNQGLNSLPGTSTIPRFSLGVEYIPLFFLPIRTGVSLGGTDKANIAFGFGLHLDVFDLDFATENLGAAISPKSFKRASFAFGTKIKI